MKLFFKKKEKSCCGTSGEKNCCETNNETANQNSRIKVLGNCCAKSTKMFENTKTAVANLELQETVINIGDFMEIAKYNVMQTPALVVDDKVLSYGKLLEVEEIQQLIKDTFYAM